MKTLMTAVFWMLTLLCAAQALAEPKAPSWHLGTWEYSHCDAEETMCMTLDITFKAGGTYEINAYPPLRHQGRYKVGEVGENKLTLNLSDQTGDWSPWKSQLRILRDPVKNTLTIDNEGPYVRLKDIKPTHREPGEK